MSEMYTRDEALKDIRQAIKTYEQEHLHSREHYPNLSREWQKVVVDAERTIFSIGAIVNILEHCEAFEATTKEGTDA